MDRLVFGHELFDQHAVGRARQINRGGAGEDFRNRLALSHPTAARRQPQAQPDRLVVDSQVRQGQVVAGQEWGLGAGGWGLGAGLGAGDLTRTLHATKDASEMARSPNVQ